jgi:hypothetical protein
MTISTDTLATLLDRFGLPTFFLVGLFALFYLVIRGPMTRFADKAGDAVAGWFTRMTASIDRTHIEHAELRGDHRAGIETVKAHVSAEASKTREHVSEAVDKIRDRVSSAENEIGAAIARQPAGSQPSIGGTPPSGMAVSPRGAGATRPE